MNDQISAILKHLRTFRKPHLLKSKWHGGDTDKDGVISMPCEEHSPRVSRFVSDLYKHGFIYDFDWGKWQRVARRYVDDPKRLQKASLATLRKLLTLHIRKDRFCEGHLTAMVECGHVTAILERLAELRQEQQARAKS